MKKYCRTVLNACSMLGRQLIVAILISTSFIFASSVGTSSVSAAPAGASAFHGVTPLRIFDTRDSAKPSAGSYSPVLVGGLANVPDSATAVVLNVTVIDADGEGYVTAFPWGEALPNSSNVNIKRFGQMVSNLVTVRLGVQGKVGLYSSISANLLVDVFGYYSSSGATAAGRFIAQTPQRLLDTRARATAGADGVVRLAMPAGIPANTEGLVLNVTAVNSRLRTNLGN